MTGILLPIIVAMIAAAAVVLAALITRGNNTAERIEILVNSRLEKALALVDTMTAAIKEKDDIIATLSQHIKDISHE